MTLKEFLLGERKSEDVFKVFKMGGSRGSFTRTEPHPENWRAFMKSGYERNPFVFRAVNLLARAASRVDWFLAEPDGEKLEDHPVSNILDNPNPELGRAALVERWLSDLVITGNSFAKFAEPIELFPLRPDAVRAVHSDDPAELVSGYEWGHGLDAETVQFPTEEVMHIKTYHPTNEYYGLSPIMAAEAAIAMSNKGFEWNVNLLEQGGIPPWVLDIEGFLNPEQKENMQEEIDDKYQGFENQGKPIIAEGDMKPRVLGQSAKDMDFVKGQKWAQRTIATALGMDPAMLGASESQTFANFETAWESMYQDTVYPYLELITTEVEAFFKRLASGQEWGTDWTIRFDEDQRKAFTGDAEEGLSDKDWWTVNEKRESDGKEEIDGGDVILVKKTKVPLVVQAGTSAVEDGLPENGETASLELYADDA